MKPKLQENKALFDSDANLWNSCDAVNLNTNFRVGDSPWNETLSRIRLGEENEEDIALLNSRKTTNFPDKNFDNAIHAFYSNKQVGEHNSKILNKMNETLVTIKAEFPNQKHKKPTKHGTIDSTNMAVNLELKKNAKVMLTQNIDVSEGLVNGVTGKVLDFAIRTVRGKKEIVAVIVQFEDENIGKHYRQQHLNLHEKIKTHNGVPIFKRKLEYKSQNRASSNKRGKDLWIRQIPLVLAFASTGHKLQGRTLKTEDLVCHGHPNIEYGVGYVMLSRCKNIEQVFLDPSFDHKKYKKLLQPHPESLIEAKKIEERCIAKKLSNQQFDIFYENMLGKNNLIEVQHDLFAKQSELVCLVETNMDKHEVHQLPGYKCFPHASDGPGTGVVCFAKKNDNDEVNYKFLGKFVNKDFQIVQLQGDYAQIFCLYVSKRANKDDVQNQIEHMRKKDLEIMIIGDFNFDSKKNIPLTQYFESLNTKQIVTGPTFVRGPNTIDHVYIPSYFDENIKLKKRFNYYSDHMSFNISFE